MPLSLSAVRRGPWSSLVVVDHRVEHSYPVEFDEGPGEVYRNVLHAMYWILGRGYGSFQ
jgi:hypothetical protein